MFWEDVVLWSTAVIYCSNRLMRYVVHCGVCVWLEKNGTRCCDGVSVLWCHLYLVRLLVGGSPLTCAHFTVVYLEREIKELALFDRIVFSSFYSDSANKNLLLLESYQSCYTIWHIEYCLTYCMCQNVIVLPYSMTRIKEKGMACQKVCKQVRNDIKGSIQSLVHLYIFFIPLAV